VASRALGECKNDDEIRAFEEFVRSFRVKYEVIAAVYGLHPGLHKGPIASWFAIAGLFGFVC